MDKPVHKVLEDYDLLNVSVIQSTNTITMTSPMLWRMNLCAVSEEIPCTFFVAMNHRVNVYSLDTIHSPFKDPKMSLMSRGARQSGGASGSPYIINAIKIGRLLEKEVLVTVAENGEVCIYRTENLQEPPMIINNGISTWGIAIHAEQGLIAVSANNWKITVFNLVEMTRDNPIYGRRSRREPENFLKSQPVVVLVGHNNNIPNIDFNESGRYLASSSIDQSCKVWDITTQEVVTHRPSAFNDPEQSNLWCWSVKFIKPGHFKYVLCIDKDVSKAYLQRYHQGRSTSLSILGLSHSATHPVYPFHVSNIEALMDANEREPIDFSMFDDPVYDNDMWDDDLQREEDEIIAAAEGDRSYEGQVQDSGDDLESGNRFSHDNQQMEEDLNAAQNDGLHTGTEEESTNGSTESSEEENNTTGPINMNAIEWGRRTRYPTRADWALSIIDDHTHENRDGWGDEIVAEMRNSSIDEPEDTTLNRLIRERTSSETSHENIPIFVPSNSNSSHWSDDKSDDTFDTADEEMTETATTTAVNRPSYCIPHAIKRSASSTERIEEKNRANKMLNPSLGEYLMISTGKDVIMMSTSTPKMSRIRAEHNVINKVDVRIDEMLSILDRINMVEWLPELELFVAASQKGTVALMRVLQVEFEGGEQGCIFNNECYLPTNVLEATPLYGMTVKKVKSDRFSPVSYQIFLFYYSGNVRGYSISRRDSNFLVENLVL